LALDIAGGGVVTARILFFMVIIDSLFQFLLGAYILFGEHADVSVPKCGITDTSRIHSCDGNLTKSISITGSYLGLIIQELTSTISTALVFRGGRCFLHHHPWLYHELFGLIRRCGLTGIISVYKLRQKSKYIHGVPLSSFIWPHKSGITPLEYLLLKKDLVVCSATLFNFLKILLVRVMPV
jgi:hypothetical protein